MRPVIATLAVLTLLAGCDRTPKRVLVFSHTEGFRHSSIETGVETFRYLAEERGLGFVATEDPSVFADESLREFAAVVFMNTTGDVLNHRQQAAFERFVQAGGGYLGVHSASDTEYDWPWYGRLVGAYFESHPRNQDAVVNVLDRGHPATEHLPESWTRLDEWYNFVDPPQGVNVLATLDESSYEGGTMDGNHPIMWYHEYDGGRAFYTAMGHTEESYGDSLFVRMLGGALDYAVGSGRLNYSRATTQPVPNANRFQREILAGGLEEPMELEVLDVNRIVLVERTGAVKMYDRGKRTLATIATLSVHTEEEDGLLGIVKDPDFATNSWIYLFYSPAGERPVQFVSRFTLAGDSLDLSSEQIIIEIPVQRDECCHAGGGLEFDTHGNLYIGVGDNTNPFASDGYAPIDERPGREPWDAQRSSANTNDLRGKILRIRPNPDGSYDIPEGNLFPPGTDSTRPEIYAMGLRNPYRFVIDPYTDYLYWGDVGPDAGEDDSTRGPRGYDLVNQARGPGFWGWPYTRGNRTPYNDHDFATGESGPTFNPDAPINESVNNTGRRELPPVADAFIWYPYESSDEFPWTGEGGRTSMAGPPLVADASAHTDEAIPGYYDGKVIAYEWMRDWMFAIETNDEGDFVEAEPFLDGMTFSNPTDMVYGPDGSLYVLEYGEGWFTANADARLNRITFTRGNRAPAAAIATFPVAGAAPLSVEVDAAGSDDPDGDDLDYAWALDGRALAEHAGAASITLSLEEPGDHEITVTVTDPSGASSIATTTVTAGNTPPDVTVTVEGNEQFFWPGRRLVWQTSVTDVEDGSLGEGIEPADVATTMTLEAGGGVAGPSALSYSGRELAERSDCSACHAVDRRVNGPSYREIAERYNDEDIGYLTRKVISGGSGVWGDLPMSAHPQLGPDEAESMVRYILSTADFVGAVPVEPSGSTVLGADVANAGQLILTATYEDAGSGAVRALERAGSVVLQRPFIQAESAPNRSDGVSEFSDDGFTALTELGDGSWFSFPFVDLREMRSVALGLLLPPESGFNGSVEIRAGSADGALLASTPIQISAVEATAREVAATLLPAARELAAPVDVFFVFRTADGGSANVDWVEFRN